MTSDSARQLSVGTIRLRDRPAGPFFIYPISSPSAYTVRALTIDYGVGNQAELQRLLHALDSSLNYLRFHLSNLSEARESSNSPSPHTRIHAET